MQIENEKQEASGRSDGVVAVVTSILAALYFILNAFVLFGVCKIQNQSGYIPLLIFAIVDFLIVIVIYGMARGLKNYLGLVFYTGVAVTTAIYIAIQYAFFFIIYQTTYMNTYIVGKLAALLLYFVIIFVIALQAGRRIDNK